MILSGKYEVTEKVGQGGMGIVYRVRHLDLDTVLALKILPRELSQDPDLVERFRREARTMARLSHANIVRVFDFAKDGDTYYLIMEFLSGRNLRQILQEHLDRTRQPLPLPEVLRVGAQIAEALAYAHGQQPAVVHRDIKPSNIIIEDGTERAVVTDFGIAKIMGESQSELTHTGLFVGTVKYCAPEQLRHDADIDARVDVYALGMLLYELYTGKQYFAGLKDHEVIGKVLYEQGGNVVDLPDTPPEFNALVARAIARDRDRRHPTAAALLKDIKAGLRALDLPTGGGAAAPVGTDEIEAQIRALERMRVQRLAEEAVHASQRARGEAERAHAGDDAPTRFAEAVAAEREGRALLERGEPAAAAERLNAAAAAFTGAGEEAARRRRERSVAQARETAADLRRQAADGGAAEVAAEALARADALAANAEKLAAAGEYERAAAELGEAAEAYGAAIATVERRRGLAELAAALPRLEAARRQAEEAGAPALLPDEFAAVIRDQERLAEALAAEQLTAAQELLARAEHGFAGVATGAARAREARASAEARAAMEAARAAARAAVAAGQEPAALADAARREAEGAAAESREEWAAARDAFQAAAALYEEGRCLADAEAVAARAREVLAAARTACDAAREGAEKGGARAGAPTLFGRARDLAKRAAVRAKAGANDDALGLYRQAEEQFTQALQVAARRAQREGLERALQEVRAARADAEQAGAQATGSFAEGERAIREAERALESDDLTAGATSAGAARTAYLAARAEIDRGRRRAEVDEALARARARGEEARRAGAEAAAEFRAAQAAAEQAAAAGEREEWERALELAGDAEARWSASAEQAVETARAAAAAAARAAETAGVTGPDVRAAEDRRRAADEARAAGNVLAAVEAYRAAEAALRALTERTGGAADEARAAAASARRGAADADAPTHEPTTFERAVACFDEAEGARRAERFADAVRGFRESATLFESTAAAATTARRRLDCVQARADAERVRAEALAAGAPDLAASELAPAEAAFAAAGRALAGDDFASAEAGFRAAATAFGTVAATSARRAGERDAQGVLDQARALRALRDPAREGRGARRKLKRADTALERGAGLLAEGGDVASARRELARAVEILEGLPPPPPAEDATSAATVVRPAPRARAVPWPGLAAGLALVVAGGAWLLLSGTEPSSPPTEVAAVADPAIRGEVPDAGREVSAPDAPAEEAAVPAAPGPAAVESEAEAEDAAATEDAAVATAEGEKAEAESEPPAQVAAVPPAPVVSPVPEPTPPPAPVIREVDPAEARIRLEAGSKAAFRVELADASATSYEWKVGGKVVRDADRPTLTVPVGDEPQTVAVVARNAGGAVEHRWELASLPRATAAPPPARAPEIVASSPRGARLTVDVGARQRFTVDAKGADRRLAYAWSVDGRTVARDAAFTLAPAADDEGATRRVRVSVTDGGGRSAEREWTVQVPALPVRISGQLPRSPATLPVGAEAELSVDARVGDRRDVPLTYQWSVDGRRVASARGPSLVHRVEGPQSDVEVRVEAPGRQAAVGRWRLLGERPPTPRPEPTPAVGNVEVEVQAWIEAYRLAYQEKNVDRLVSLGVLTADNRDRMRRALEALEGLQVRIVNRAIDVQGPDRATVSLTRVDRFSSGRGEEEKSIPIEKTLRKRNGRWVAD